MALPSFEFVDPEDLGLVAANEEAEGEELGDEDAERRRRRGRRGGRRRRRKEPGVMTAAEALAGASNNVTPITQRTAPEPAPVANVAARAGDDVVVVESPPKKAGFWARLFGRG